MLRFIAFASKREKNAHRKCHKTDFVYVCVFLLALGLIKSFALIPLDITTQTLYRIRYIIHSFFNITLLQIFIA